MGICRYLGLRLEKSASHRKPLCMGGSLYRVHHESMKTTEKEAVEGLIALSNQYGTGTDYVIAGGGNTSWKSDSVLWVKGSGQSLSTIQADGFVKVNRQALAALWAKTLPSDTDEREKQVLAELMAARLPGEEHKRPSVETLLHDLMPFTYVVHTHPTLVNAITCAQDGEKTFQRLFAKEAVWIPLVNPGYILSKIVKDALEGFQKKNGKIPAIIFMQNHGIVVAGNTAAEIDAAYARIMKTIRAEVKTQADLAPLPVDAAAEARFLAALLPEAKKALAAESLFLSRVTGKTALALAADTAGFAPLSSAYSPDHIVYMGVSPIRVDSPAELPAAFAAYQAKWKKAPRVVLAKGLGAFCIGPTEKTAAQAHLLFLDAAKIAVTTPSFGGPRFMTPEHIDFIVNWEVEAFRSQVSSK